MRTLYFKIFLWFWLATALVGVAFVISTATLQSSEAESRWRAFVTSGLTLSGQSAIDAYRDGGPEGLNQFFRRLERRSAIRAYLLDEQLEELGGRPVPAGGVQLAGDALTSPELLVEEFEDSRLVALGIGSADGDSYVLLADIEWPFRAGGRARDRFDTGRRRGSQDADAPGVGPQGRADDVRPGVPDPNAPAAGLDARAPGFRRGAGREAPPWYAVWLSAIDQPGSLALRMAAILITAGALCYGLARYLTAPVQRLRDAAQRLASGDLGFRVGPALGGRRDELAELGRDFDLMAARIESLVTAQRQLLSDVSHELRSPLARLNVALGLARRHAGESAQAPLDRIEAEADQLNSLIGRVLALARLESDSIEIEFADVDVSRLVADVAADADFEAEPKGTSVVVDPATSCRVRADESLLRSAIENVVRNAVRYTAPGTDVEISVTRYVGRAAASTSAGAEQVTIAVRDHGPGVPEDRLDDLFEPFYRLADSRDRQSGGTGLGLSIARRAVRLHGGTLSAANAPDGGLIVRIGLPLAPDC